MLTDVYNKLLTLGIPVAYLKFDTDQTLPFLMYYESSTEIAGADGYNLVRRTDITIELYTESKNPELERQIEELFREYEIYKSADTFVENENMIQTIFEFETIDKIE